jgi:SAM-dependent methyltransferase
MTALTAPAAERNKQPILDVLERVLPATGLVLEIASGTGQHVAHFAKALTSLTWQPSDPDPRARESISAWIAEERLTNVREPLDLDVRRHPWPVSACDALVCINMIHISPWTATEALFEGAARVLPQDAVVYLYGPYQVNGRHTAESNAAFDATLRAQEPEWGVRDMEAVVNTARRCGFEFLESVAMPANNLSVILRKGARAPSAPA